MIKAKFTFLQMKIESMFLHPPETNQASFGIGPKAFYPINVTMLVGKLIFSMLHSVMFLIAKVYKTIIATPTVRMNNAFGVYTTLDNVLQRSSGTIWNYFCINTTMPFEETKYNCFPSGTSSSKTTDTTSTKITFINFDLARDR